MKNILNFKNRAIVKPRKKIINAASIIILALVLLANINELWAEGSGTWTGTQTGRKTYLFVPDNTANLQHTGYDYRGYMMLPSTTTGYNATNRFYVYVKAGETVFWGFHRQSGSTAVTATWYYDASGYTGLYPTGTSGTAMTFFSSGSFNDVAAIGTPSTQDSAYRGPKQVTGSTTLGYRALSFKNTTGADHVFWVELSDNNLNIDWWDVTVASGSAGNYTAHNGRVYCRYWSMYNDLPDVVGSPNSGAYHDDFTYYVPVENKNNLGTYIVKSINFGRSNGGNAVFFSNSKGPTNGTDAQFAENRKSIAGVSSNNEYPLFINDPDITLFPTSPAPTASQSVQFTSNSPSAGGHAVFTVTIDNPSVVDILVDLNNDGIKNGNDVLISDYFTTSGTHTINWDGKDASTAYVPSGTTVYFKTSFLFYPIHFPIFDVEQSLGITIKNIRPGEVYNELIYWDDVNLEHFTDPPITPPCTAPAVITNTTGLTSPEHIWWANGNKGFSQEMTVNSWTGSKVVILSSSFYFDYSGADLDLKMNLVPSNQVVGSNVTFTLTAKNNGLSPATGVQVSDLLPAGYSYVSDNGGGNYNNGTGVWTIGPLANGASTSLTITAAVLSTGNYTNTATISGAQGDPDPSNNTASQTLVNRPTIALNDANITFINTSVSGNVLTNDYDPQGNALTVSSPGTDIPTSHGKITIASNGVYTYTPNTGYTGDDSYTYQVCDNGRPQQCASGTLALQVIPLQSGSNNAPVAVNDAYQGSFNRTVSGNVIANDFDSDGNLNTTSVTLTSATPNPATQGTLTLNANGTFTFVPVSGFLGTVSFTYQVCDHTLPTALCDQATVTIEYKSNSSGNTTFAINDGIRTLINTAATGNVLTNDYDPEGNTQTVTTTGTIATSHGSITIAANGAYTFTPTAGYTGDDTFTYSISDNGSPVASDKGILTISIYPADTGGNDAPIAVNDAFHGPANSVISGNVITNDYDIDGNLNANGVTLMSGGSATTNGILTLNSNGTFTYVPYSGFVGQVSFIYQTSDNGTPSLVDQALVTIDVTPVTISTTATYVNSTYAINDVVKTNVSQAVSGNVLMNDYDPEGNNLSIIPAGIGTFSTTHGSITIAADGSYVYTPTTGYIGDDTYSYSMTDNGSPAATDNGNLTITMMDSPTAGNDAPVALNDVVYSSVNTVLTGNVISNDYDVDGNTLTVSSATVALDNDGVVNDVLPLSTGTPIYGTNTLGATVVAGTLTLTSAGALTFVGAANFQGTATFTYVTTDGSLTDNATVYLYVIGGNSFFAVDDAFIVEKDHVLSSINVLTNDYDPQGNTPTVNTTAVMGPFHGTYTLAANGDLTYTPTAGYSGTDYLIYSVTDNGTPQASDKATVYFEIYSSGLPCLISNNPTHSK